MAQNEKVIISVELRDKGVTTGSKKAKDSIDGLSESAKRLAKAERDLKFEESDEAKKLAELTVKRQLASKANKELAISTLKTADATKQGKTQTGLNNAILVEAGRAASDFQYGMQGMANNIGQLSTLMGQHIQTQGGFIASMTELGKSLLGVQGVLIAVQLFISFLPKIEKYVKSLKGEIFSLSESLKGAGTDAGETIGDFKIFIDTIQSSEKSVNEKKDALNALNKEFPEFISNLDEAGLSLDDVANNTEDAKKQTELYTEAIKKQAIAEAARSKIQEASGKELDAIIQAELKAQELGYKSVDEMREAAEEARIKAVAESVGIRAGFGNSILSLIPEQMTEDAINLFKKVIGSEGTEALLEIDKLDKAVKLAKTTKEELLKYIDIKPKDSKDSNSLKRFKESLLNLSKLELKYRRETEEIRRKFEGKEAESKRDKILREEREAIEDVNLVKTNFIKKEKARLLHFQKGKALSEEQVRVIEGQAEKETKKVIDEINKRTDAQLDSLDKLTAFESSKKFAEKLKLYQEKAQKIGSLAKSFIDADIQAEQARTVKINNELRERLNNENLSAEERKKIQLKIAANDAAAAKKKDKLAEKQFKIDKALAISSGLVNTFSATLNVFNETKGGLTTRLIAAAAAAAFGLAKVAAISKQKFIPSATSAPAIDTGGGSGGGATSVQPPSFNIVGSSGVNQLSDAISEAEKQPTRAYVVASDVTTAQELDRNIIESASL